MPQYHPVAKDEQGSNQPLLPKREKPSFFRSPILILLLILCGLALVLGIFMFSGLVIPRKSNSSIKIWQTSQFHGDRHTAIDNVELIKRGFEVEDLVFRSKKECKENRDPAEPPCVPEDVSKIKVDPDMHYQSVIGFGGAFTEAAAHNYFRLPEAIRKKVIELYFGKKGIGYTMGRVHINSCDFSLDSYSFDDVSKDYDLKFFDMQVTHDQAEMIPFIKDAMKEIATASSTTLKLLASPWSPPAWLKLPGPLGKRSMSGSATPNCLRHETRASETWAKYISLFIDAYRGQGVPVWAITPQNEPLYPAPWEACSYNTSSMYSFITQYLGPTLDTSHPEVLILGYDHNKDHLLEWAEELLAGEGREYVDGMAFHWYAGNDRLMDGTYGYDMVNATHHLAPEKVLLASEGCSCPGVRVGDWLRAERLGHDLIFDLNNWANGWLDWNLLLDSEGGPNHLKNYCDANIIALPGYSDVYIQPSFYYMGHISKYIPPGSKRIRSSVVGNYRYANVDPGVRAGIELGMYPCELSTRQLWRNENQIIKLMKKSVDTEQPDGLLVVLCVADGDENRRVLRLVACEYDGQPTPIKLTLDEPYQWLRDNSTGKCIDIVNGVLEPGAILELNTCSTVSLTQQFIYDDNSGEIRSAATGYCMTAGWPFLTGTSFVDKSKHTVVVVMNEAPVDTELVLEDTHNGLVASGINARSIQTIVYETN